MNKCADMDVVWIVSFQVDDAGRFLDYQVDRFDFQEHPGSVDNLCSLLGKGVFKSAEEAKEWAERQFFLASTRGCGRCGGCSGDRGCCHK